MNSSNNNVTYAGDFSFRYIPQQYTKSLIKRENIYFITALSTFQVRNKIFHLYQNDIYNEVTVE